MMNAQEMQTIINNTVKIAIESGVGYGQALLILEVAKLDVYMNMRHTATSRVVQSPTIFPKG